MKKKALSTLLAVSMVVGMVTGCGSSADQTAASTDTATGAGIYDDCIFHLPCYSCISGIVQTYRTGCGIGKCQRLMVKGMSVLTCLLFA